MHGRILARNALWNLAGQLAPVVFALVAIPVLISSLGKDRFGVLTLIWAAIGYFGLFDFGLGRALTQTVGAALGTNDLDSLESLPRTALGLMVGFGMVAAVLVFAVTPWLVRVPLKVPASLQGEAAMSFYLLGVSLPFVLATAGLRGLLEAHQDFEIATAIRVPFAAVNYLGPMVAVAFSHSLVPSVATLLIGRIGAWLTHRRVCLKRYAYLSNGRPPAVQALWSLIRTGAWMTVSNVISPLMYNVDRFFVGALLSMAAVTYYVTAFELASKLLLIPAAILGVLFPAMASAYAGDPDRACRLTERAIRIMTVLMFIPVVLVVALAHIGLRVWVGAEMARVDTRLLQCLVIGVLANSIAQIPFAAIQAVGRPDVTAKLHLVELPAYVVVLVWLTRSLGVQGVAIAWTARMTIDCVALLVLAAVKVPALRAAVVRPLGFVGAAIALAGLPALVHGATARAFTTSAVICVFAVIAWRWGIGRTDRELARRALHAAYRRERARAA